MKPIVALIAALGPDRTIGSDNKMPWHLPRDLRYFRRVTSGHTVIMGRKTFEAIGSRPLPKRRNIVITRNKSFETKNCEVAHSIDEAINLAADEERVFIIGGGELYRQSISFADELYITHIIDSHPNQRLFPLFESDTLFPEISPKDWEIYKKGRKFIASSKLTEKPSGAASEIYLQFVTYKRKSVPGISET